MMNNTGLIMNDIMEKIKKPREDDSIWRYMDLSKFVYLLGERLLYFAPSITFEDPYEGVCDIDLLEYKYDDEDVKSLYDAYNLQPSDLPLEEKYKELKLHCKKVKQATLISCWHVNNHLSDAMWKLFSKDVTTAIAIRTTYGNLKDIFGKNPFTYMGLIEYTSYEEGVPSLNEAFWKKRNVFEHEREFRIIMQDENLGDVLYSENGRALKSGGVHPNRIVCPNKLIEEVVVSPYAQEWFKDAVVDLMKAFGLKKRIWYKNVVNKELVGDSSERVN